VPTDASLLPIAYLGSGTEADFDKLCRFQVVAVIDSACWQNPSLPAHAMCTNSTHEEDRIIAISSKLKQQCPAVTTQMYLNSLMNFYWYKLHGEFRGANASQLLHDVNGELVRVLQDGGNPNQTVWDWGQAETRGKFLALADRAVGSGITSFFLDKASVSTHNTSEHGRQICVDNQPLRHCSGTVSEAVGDAWDAGHKQVVL
jgi:hypothetical protein